MDEDPNFLKGKTVWILEIPGGVHLTARVLSRILDQRFPQMARDCREENMVMMRSQHRFPKRPVSTKVKFLFSWGDHPGGPDGHLGPWASKGAVEEWLHYLYRKLLSVV